MVLFFTHQFKLSEKRRMILVENLSKTFHDKKRGVVKAVDGVSFECRPGEIFGLLGPNGAGKTTTLRMLATILEPTGGSASVAGHDIRTESQQVRKSIGFLSNSAGLYERLTAREVVAYFGRLNGLGESEIVSRIKQVFDELDMNDFADGRCDGLSTGQKQRVSIARAIIHQPPVLFFDEPTNGLDVMVARTVMQFILRCKAEGKTIVFSTHIMPDVQTVCDRVAIIAHGHLAKQGTPEELMDEQGVDTFGEAFFNIIDAGENSSTNASERSEVKS